MGVLLAGYWRHNLDPFAIKFPEGFFIPGIRWYGLAYLAGFLAGWYLLRRLAQRGRLGGVHPIEVGDLVFWLAVGAVLGGRIGYAFLYNFQVTVTQPWTLLQVWQGGMASHGGIIGVTFAAIGWWSRRPISAAESGAASVADSDAMDEHGRTRTGTEGDPQHGADATAPDAAAAPTSPESQATPSRARKRRSGPGRGGSRPSPADNRGGGSHAGGKNRHADADADFAAPRSLEGSFFSRWRQTLRMATFWRMGDGVVAVTPLGLFFGRVANFINGELWGRPSELPWAVVFPDSPPPLTPRHPSALYEAALEGIFLFLWLFPGAWRAKWRPGGAVARFIIGYAAVRFLVEFFREPDLGIGYEWLNLTRGQWLSAAMAAGGLVLLAWLAPLARKSR